MTTPAHIAQFNIGRLLYDESDPRGAEYIAASNVVNKVAVRSAGFVWKHQTTLGGATGRVIDGDPRIVMNLSVWESLAVLEHFVWNTLHKKIWVRRAEWFAPLGRAAMVLWRVAPGHRPSVDEAEDRLRRLRAEGAGEAAFDWAWAREAA